MSKEIPEDVFKPFSNVSNKEIYQAAIVDNRNGLQVNDLDRIDVYCNNKLCENVKAFIAPNRQMHFYDDKTRKYFTTPPSDYIKQHVTNLQPRQHKIRCVHRKSQVIEEFHIWWYNACIACVHIVNYLCVWRISMCCIVMK